jgi:adenylyltransferase/sulfurtransferase
LAEDRYSRQTRFSAFGVDGQERLGDATAVIVGCGALGSAQASLLARAGAGTLRLIDRDYVEESNLQRQVLYTESDAREALPKAEAARRHLTRVNSRIRVEAAIADLEPGTAEDLLAGAAVILDGTDNFETRLLINDWAVRESVPWIYGAAVGSYGIAFPVLPSNGPCFRCIYPEPPQGGDQPTCETAGVMGAVTNLIASVQVMEAMKIMGGKPESVRRKILTADLWSGPIRESSLPVRDPACPCCSKHDFVWLRGEKRAPVSLCGRNAVQIHDRSRPIDLLQLAERLKSLGGVRANEFALRFEAGQHEMTIFPDGRAIIRGTTDAGIARSLYSRFIGN